MAKKVPTLTQADLAKLDAEDRAFAERLFAAYETEGASAIEELRVENPEAYLRVAVLLIPDDVRQTLIDMGVSLKLH